jgi:hypothetical protein
MIINFGFTIVILTRSLYISLEIGNFLTEFSNYNNIYNLNSFA